MKELAIEKIKKLLNLAEKAGTEGEAKAAFAAASKLMTRHGIEQHEVAEKEKEEFTRETFQTNNARPRPTFDSVRQVIGVCFNVQVAHVRNSKPVLYYMLGEADKIEFAKYAWDVLNTAFRKLTVKHLKRTGEAMTGSSVAAQSYIRGLEAGFIEAYKAAEKEQIKRSEAESYAIVLASKEQALVKWIKESQDVKYRNHRVKTSFDHYGSGVRDGRNIKIHQALNS